MSYTYHQPLIDVPYGVSCHGFDTYLLVEHMVKLPGKKLLDIGTGTGYVAIVAAQLGKQCVAVDISRAACEVAQKNIEKNKVEVTVIQSDLFDNVSGSFDIVVFNPPYGSSSTQTSSILEFVKSLVPRNNVLVAEAAFLMVRTSRKKLIGRFLERVGEYLTDNGTILLLLHRLEVEHVLKTYDGRIVGNSQWMRLVEIPASSF